MELKGKTILFLGSSVTYGSAANGESFVDMLAEEGCCVVKEAVSGTTLADIMENSYVARMKQMDKEISADLFVCQLSTNDASRKIPLGEMDEKMDVATVAGAIEYIIRYAKETWNCPVAFYTNPRYESEDYAKMVALIKAFEEKGEIGLVDLWSNAEFNDLSEAQRKVFLADPIHPTREGYREWWLPVFRTELGRMCK